MKRWLIALIVTVAVMGFSAGALAAVQGTHHDMGTYVGTGGPTTAGRDTCYPCHGFQDAGTTPNALLKTVGSMCYNRCHLGGGAAGGVFPLANAMPEIGVFNPTGVTDNTLRIGTYAATTIDKYTQGHKMTHLVPGPDAEADVTATGWPYAGDTTNGMQCTTCHDVHENTYTPFIRAPLSDNVVANRATMFCHRCHQPHGATNARWSDLSVAAIPNGAHPSEADWQNATSRNANSRLPRSIQFRDRNQTGTAEPGTIGDNAVFRNWSYRGAELNNRLNHYNPGGKLGDFRGSGNVGCYTCHATHLPTISGYPQLIVAKYLASGVLYQSDMCVGCHGRNARTANPGNTDYYHPVDTETIVANYNPSSPETAVYTMSTGTDNITVNMSGVYDNAVGGRLSCMSCHAGLAANNTTVYGVHNGTAGASILSPAKPNCASCHRTTALQAGTTPNSHHVYGGSTNYASTQGYNGTVVFNASASANLTDGLSCEDCHVGNGTAHNWN